MYTLPNISPNEIIMYLRKSRTDDPMLTVEEVLSKHEQMLDEWSSRHFDGETVPQENRFREVVSGETITDRPEVQKVLRIVESPKYKAILVVEPQRLSRGDLEDAGKIIKLLRYSNTIVLTLSYNYDLSDEMDRENFARELKRGNEFLEYQKRIMGNGRMLSVENGNYICSKPPYGYDKVQYKDGKRTYHTLKENENQAPVVKLIFDLYLNHSLGATKICDKLEEIGACPANGSKWSPATIYTILQNPHYTGKVKWNSRPIKKTISKGEVVSHRPRETEYMLFQGKHPAIIGQETFDAVQNKLGQIPKVKKSTELQNPFAGILYCSCGNKMSLRTYSARGKVRCQSRVLCYDQRHCKTPSATSTDLNEAMISSLTNTLADFEINVKSKIENNSLQQKTIEQLEAKISELEKTEIKQWDEYLAGNMPQRVFDQLNGRLVNEKNRIEKSLKNARESMPDIKKIQDFVIKFHKAIDALKNPNISATKKNNLLHSCVEKIVYNRTRIDDSHNITGSIDLEVYLKI